MSSLWRVDGRRRHRHRGRSTAIDDTNRGQALVEFAFVVPIALILLVAVGDMARLYTTMITVESAAREAADFGAYGSANWSESNRALTLKGMEQRACVASRHLSDYAGTGGTCTNPAVTIALLEPNGTTADETSGCDQPDRAGGPCRVQVDLDYMFDMIAPIGLEVGAQRFGFPDSYSFRRSSIFAISDFVAPA